MLIQLQVRYILLFIGCIKKILGTLEPPIIGYEHYN